MCSNARNFTVFKGHMKLIHYKANQSSGNDGKFRKFNALSRSVAISLGSHYGWQPLTTKKQHINNQIVYLFQTRIPRSRKCEGSINFCFHCFREMADPDNTKRERQEPEARGAEADDPQGVRRGARDLRHPVHPDEERYGGTQELGE